MLKRTTAQDKISRLRRRFRVVQGGTSSSKTYTIIPMLITYALQHEAKVISIVSETMPHLKRGVIRDFRTIMIGIGNWRDEEFNKTESIYTFPNGSVIEFFSADQPSKVLGARRDVLFVNEANNVPFEIFHQLQIRTREFIYIDYNPSSEFWSHTEVIPRKDCDFLILTYKDNEALTDSLVKEIEVAREKAYINPNLPASTIDDEGNIKDSYWHNWWKVYGLGQVGRLQGSIFQNWRQVKKIPEGFVYIGTGLDFGFSNDPTAAVDVYKKGNSIFVRSHIYEPGLVSSEVAQRLKSSPRDVFADPSASMIIEEIRRAGVRIRGVKNVGNLKKILNGIDLLQRLDEILVGEDDFNLINEFRNYVWKMTRSGDPTNEPIDTHNHAMDAIRYLAVMKLSSKASGNYDIR